MLVFNTTAAAVIFFSLLAIAQDLFFFSTDLFVWFDLIVKSMYSAKYPRVNGIKHIFICISECARRWRQIFNSLFHVENKLMEKREEERN